MPEPQARRTPLHDIHVRLGARFTEFGGWEMPVRYGSIIDEHRAVREAAGLFDLSHMGELRVTGSGAGEGLARALVNDPRRLPVGRAGYSLLCQPDGGVIDETLVRWDAEKKTLAFHRDRDDVKSLPAINYMTHVTVKPTADGRSLDPPGRSLREWGGSAARSRWHPTDARLAAQEAS